LIRHVFPADVKNSRSRFVVAGWPSDLPPNVVQPVAPQIAAEKIETCPINFRRRIARCYLCQNGKLSQNRHTRGAGCEELMTYHSDSVRGPKDSTASAVGRPAGFLGLPVCTGSYTHQDPPSLRTEPSTYFARNGSRTWLTVLASLRSASHAPFL